MRYLKFSSGVSTLFLSLTLACGGGGGSGTPTPPAPSTPFISSFTAAQGTVAPGASTTLTGVFTNGTGSINNGVGSIQSGVAISSGPLQATTTFSLTVTGSGGTTTASTTVTVPPKTFADNLVYTDPVGTGFRLMRNAGSSGGNLILDLVGPVGTGQGVAFIFNSDQTKVTWANPAAFNLAFTLGSGTQALIAKASGNVLQAAVFQKPGATSVNLAQPLIRFSLALKSSIPVNTPITISVSGANQLATPAGTPAPITVAVGILVAQ